MHLCYYVHIGPHTHTIVEPNIISEAIITLRVRRFSNKLNKYISTPLFYITCIIIRKNVFQKTFISPSICVSHVPEEHNLPL